MTDALTRAARAACAAWGFDWDEPIDEDETTNGVHLEGDEWPARNNFAVLSRAAILSFLSGEDVVEACARAICASQLYASAWDSLNDGSKESYRKNARASLAALRALVQEEK